MNVIIIQARLKSNRLPNKVLLKLCDKTVLEHIYDRCKICNVGEVVVAIPNNEPELENFCNKKRIKYFIGDPADVLNRFYECANKYNASNIVRITADCPCIDYTLINDLLEDFKGMDFISNAWLGIETLPDGMDVSIVSRRLLNFCWANAAGKHREHVLSYIMENSELFNEKKVGYRCYNSYLDYTETIRLTLDNIEDYDLIKEIYNKLYVKNKYFGLVDIINLYKNDTRLFKINSMYSRNSSYYRDKSWVI